MLTHTFFNAFTGTRPGFHRSHGRPFPVRFIGLFRDHFRARRQYRQMLEMPDYLFDDIGLSRWQIEAELRRGLF